MTPPASLARGSTDAIDRPDRPRIAYVIGWPIGHSRSPAMFDAAFSATGIAASMLAMGVAPERLAVAVGQLRDPAVLGASVTIPHKHAIVALCDELAATARATGAVNCVQRLGERLIGHNTDGGGFLDGLTAAGFAPAGARVVVLGAGGAARAVVHALRDAHVDVVARRSDAVTWIDARPWTDEVLRVAFAAADLVVDCTSAGLAADTDTAVVPVDALPDTALVATLIYHREPALIAAAAARGLRTLDGRAMLVHQAARAFTLWTGLAAPIEVMTQALVESLR